MPHIQEKVKILNELEELVSLKRKIHQKRGLSNFIKSYLSHLTPKRSPEFHYEMFGDLSETSKEDKDKKYNRLLFVAPRGFAKSTLCSRFYPLWLALNGFRKDIFIVSATISLAKEHLRAIREEIAGNEKVLSDFGDLKSDKWTEEHVILNNGVQIRAKGRGFQIRGFRPDVIIADDLEDEEVIYSKEQRDKLQNWYLRTLLPSLQPEQNVVYVGTKLHQFSLISELEKKDEFFERFYKALVDEKSIWEELFPTETLKALRKEMGEYAFQSEFMNNPISLDEQPVKPHMVKDVKVEGGKELRCMAIDPAISEKESSDYRAITVFDRTNEGFKEVHSEHGKWTIIEQVEKIVDYYKKFKPNRVVIEEVAFQKILRDQILERGRKEKVFIPVTSAELGMGRNKRPKDKFSRLMEVVHLFEQKLVQIDNPVLREEILAFPFGDYDDLVDATVYSLYWLMSSREGKVLSRKSEEEGISGKESFYVDEVRPGVYVTRAGRPKIETTPKGFYNFDK